MLAMLLDLRQQARRGRHVTKAHFQDGPVTKTPIILALEKRIAKFPNAAPFHIPGHKVRRLYSTCTRRCHGQSAAPRAPTSVVRPLWLPREVSTLNGWVSLLA